MESNTDKTMFNNIVESRIGEPPHPEVTKLDPSPLFTRRSVEEPFFSELHQQRKDWEPLVAGHVPQKTLSQHKAILNLK